MVSKIKPQINSQTGIWDHLAASSEYSLLLQQLPLTK